MLGLFLPQERGTLFTGLDESQTTSTNPPKQRGVEEIQLSKKLRCSIWGQGIVFQGLDE